MSDLIDEVSYRQLGTLAENILNVLALDILHFFDAAHDVTLIISGFECSGVGFACLLEEKYPSLVHEEV